MAVLLLVLGATLVSACGGGGGGGGNDKNATSLLNTAFHQPIKSADLNLDLSVQVNGVSTLTAPISVKVAGPYVNNGPGKLPSMDLNANISGGGQSIPFGLTSTGDNLFVTVRGQSYEVGKQTVAKLNQQLASQKTTGQKTSLSELGISPLSWLENAKNAGDSTIAGTKVTHVSATLNVDKLLNDLNRVVQKAPAGSLNGASKPPRLTDQQKAQIEKVVKNPHIDVYVAKSDNTVRRIATTLQLSVPKDQRSKVNGATGGTLQLSIEFDNVGGSQQIKAPSGAKPIGDLASQLNALGGSLGAAGSGSSSSGSGSSSPSGSSSGTPSAQQFQKYADCIKKAGGNDATALQKCASLLNK